MSSEWTTSGPELLLALDPLLGRREALEHALRDAIRTGRLASGTRLPSTRALARDLGVARGTVVEGYAQLVAEGWLSARQGSGTVVAATAAPADSGTDNSERPPETAPRFVFHPGLGDLTAFPRALWLRSLRRALRSAPADVLGYGDPRGRPELRATLAAYLARARGVSVAPEHVVLCGGFGQGFGVLARVLRASGMRRIAMEDPCLAIHREAARAAGLEVVALPVDDAGAQTAALGDLRADAVLLTPAHQFPLGATLAPERRDAVVRWARATGGLVIEDDYDGELRYDRHPVGALQARDPEHVVYAGSASKTFAPGLRLGWLVLPPRLVDPVCERRRIEDRHAPVLDQLAFADLVAGGAFERHLRRVRGRYRTRRDRLGAALPAGLTVRGISAGLHAVVELPDGVAERDLIARAAEASIALWGLEPYHHAGPRQPGALVVGYGTPPEHAFGAALAALTELLASLRS